MGIEFDFGKFENLIGKLDKAKSVEGDLNHIDTKKELNLFVTGFDAIKKNAEIEGATETDLDKLEAAMKDELSNIMDVKFGEKAGQKEENGKVVFNESDDVLADMMNILAQSPVEGSDGIDINKLRAYNKKVMQKRLEEKDEEIKTMPWAVMNGLEKFGFDQELIDVIVDESPATLDYISNAIKTGSAKNISNYAQAADEYANNTMDMDILGYIRYQYQR